MELLSAGSTVGALQPGRYSANYSLLVIVCGSQQSGDGLTQTGHRASRSIRRENSNFVVSLQPAVQCNSTIDQSRRGPAIDIVRELGDGTNRLGNLFSYGGWKM